MTSDIAAKTGKGSGAESAFLCNVVSSGLHQWKFKINYYSQIDSHLYILEFGALIMMNKEYCKDIHMI